MWRLRSLHQVLWQLLWRRCTGHGVDEVVQLLRQTWLYKPQIWFHKVRLRTAFLTSKHLFICRNVKKKKKKGFKWNKWKLETFSKWDSITRITEKDGWTGAAGRIRHIRGAFAGSAKCIHLRARRQEAYILAPKVQSSMFSRGVLLRRELFAAFLQSTCDRPGSAARCCRCNPAEDGCLCTAELLGTDQTSLTKW